MTDDDKEPPLYSPEWFTWVEGRYLGTDYDETPAPQPVMTTFILWDGDPAVIVKTGAWAKAVRLDAVAGWVTVDPSALWFDEPRNVIAQPDSDLPSSFGDTTDAMRLLEAERWQELKQPARQRWGED